MKLIIAPECPTAGYLQLPKHPGGGQGIVKRSVQLCDLLGLYVGPDIILDLQLGLEPEGDTISIPVGQGWGESSMRAQAPCGASTGTTQSPTMNMRRFFDWRVVAGLVAIFCWGWAWLYGQVSPFLGYWLIGQGVLTAHNISHLLQKKRREEEAVFPGATVLRS